jgi:hypothetical protein
MSDRGQQRTGLRALRDEGGTTLVLVAAMMVVLIGMLGFAVDLGWLYLQQTNARKAAEAAALAGVVNMPAVGAWGTGEPAYDTAIDVAARNGYSSGVTPLQVPGEKHQLEVIVDTTVDTFFMRLFGIDTVDIEENAIAEALPPLKLGSDEPILGNDPTTGTWKGFWLAVNGTAIAKGQGDPFSTHCTGPDANNNCSPPLNPDYRDPAYYIAFDVPASDAGQSLAFQVFDPQLDGGGLADDKDDDRDGNYAVNSTSNVMNTRFTVYRPDATPSDPSDNSVQVNGGCSHTYVHEFNYGWSSLYEDRWTSVCTTTSTAGIYVMALHVDGNSGDLNSYAVRALVNGSVSNNVAVYGIGAMSIWNTGGGWQPGGTVANFDLMEVTDAYAGEQIVVGLWDVGDLNYPGALEFRGSVAGYECQYRVLDQYRNVVRNWSADDGDSASSQCRLAIGVQEHNNQWIEVRFDIPDSHSCSGSACWSSVYYNFSGGAHDRTTWTASVNGQPVHLLPNQ